MHPPIAAYRSRATATWRRPEHLRHCVRSSVAERIAVAGWGIGVAISDDRGKTWQDRNAGLPGTAVWSVAFDPAHPGRVYASVHEEALYVSQDYGRTWTKDGLEGSRVYRMRFVPEAPRP